MLVCDSVRTTSVTLISFLTVVVSIAASQSQGYAENLNSTGFDDSALNVNIDALSASSASSFAILSEQTIYYEYVTGTGHEAVIFDADINKDCQCTMQLHSVHDVATVQSSLQERGVVLTNSTSSTVQPASQNAPATALHSSNVIDTRALLESHHHVHIQCTGGIMECSAQPDRLILVNCGVGDQCRDRPLRRGKRGDHSGVIVGPGIIVRPITADSCSVNVNELGGRRCVQDTSEPGLMHLIKHTNAVSVSQIMMRWLLRAFVLLTSVCCVLGGRSQK